MGVYAGLTVVELAGDIAGAVAGQACANRGANVIKVEPPEGDALRRHRPFEDNESKLFQALNRGKRSVVIGDQARDELIDRLIANADVVIVSVTDTSNNPFALEYDRARAINPAVVFVQVDGFGPRGEWSGRKANDLVMQAFSGALMSERKTRDDGTTPDIIRSTRFTEFGSGFMLTLAISSALFHRARTGEGQRVETSLLNNILFLQGGRAVENDMADERTRPARLELLEARAAGKSLREIALPLRTPLNAFYRSYQTRDGAVFVGALSRPLRDKARQALSTSLMARDDPDWDPRNPEHMEQALAQQRDIERRMKQKTTAEWVTILEAAGVPTGEVVFPEDLPETPHLHANHYLLTIPDDRGDTLQVAPPVRFGRFPDYRLHPSPALGQDTTAVLAEIGVRP